MRSGLRKVDAKERSSSHRKVTTLKMRKCLRKRAKKSLLRSRQPEQRVTTMRSLRARIFLN